ncbi:contact-dependent growth inhibition system immunity protein [Zooshikella harenae]|uniref:CdiI immunity protein domain-containing protein n=1 Tax=Zooshikella harenae TaxID=2827238 RepID=A0ABS5ZCY5_9GAMM|nr:contact-dependent growth inhibition system immunity protein [Zooshikella harenae]MBU2711908.1 hypothetical protein [Zooshikella harenae]
MMNDKYPVLTHLFSCYFHQDWPDEFDSPDMALDAFVDSETAEFVKIARDELKKIIDSGCSDNEILRLLNELGCYYEPTADYSSAVSWLKDINRKLSFH